MEFEFDPKQLQETKSYAVSNEADADIVSEDTIDCSMGVNPYGFSKAVKPVIRSYDVDHFFSYPHSQVHFDALIEYWKGICDLKKSNIFFTNGSVGGIYFLNAVFSRAKKTEVVGYYPTFTDTVESMKNFGLSYKGVPIHLEDGGRIDADELIAAIGPETGLVYIDRPHNPTGQTMPLEDVEKIVKACRDNGAYCYMDEAYGDFIEKEECSLKLFEKYDNLIVSKTFSKGFGLANLRMGYVVANETLTGILNRLGNPYILSDLYRNIIEAILFADDLPTSHCAEIAASKKALRGVIGNKIEMLRTDDRVAICTLHLKDGGDLLSYLKSFGILAVPGAEFDLLDESYVRFRIPAADQMDALLERISNADK